MAVVWAKSNGNWTTTTLWAFWNETTQQIEDYGQVPQIGDVVYCNGNNITVVTNIITGMVTNAVNPYTNTGGGKIVLTNTNYSLSSNFDAVTNEIIFINKNNPVSLTINGNINGYSDQYIFERSTNDTLSLIINGNVHCECTYFIWNNSQNIYLFNCTINGRYDIFNYYSNRDESSRGTLAIAGIFSIYKNAATYNTIISGVFSAHYSVLFTNSLTINGSITYKSTNNTMGVRYTTLNILNPDTFTWKDVTEPRSNPFIILTDAEMNNRQQYPSENEVKEGTEYVWGEKVGTYQAPPESVVLKDYVYDNGDKVGTLENQNVVGCVTKEDVREGVELIGLQEVGTLVVPDVDDVREGVVFDNGSVGTLIVEGGGDRLRIANFGYYTDSQSDTYIVDINESFKPMFATAEESVLLELFPELDLDNIPDKYFDDLFVKYLKYRLIVEYYRGAGINSVFTPSELTTEVVNYQNVRCEYWLNLANIYLNAWDKKYPNSVKKQRILL